MRRAKIHAAEQAAKLFLERVKAVDAELRDIGFPEYICGTMTSGALRRASMELTRALAEMRKP